MFVDNEEDDEGILENEIVNNIRKFIMSMGKGYSFIGNQYKLEVNNRTFLWIFFFYNRHLQYLAAIELKRKNLNRNMPAS